MHRSGTSAVAGLLDRLGCYFGPAEQQIPPHACNPKGFHERMDVLALHDAILGGCGASWLQPHRFAVDRLEKERRRGLSYELQTLVRGLDEHRPWYVKDPRLCLTVEMWLEVLTDPFVVITVRNPLEIARSLAQRGECSVPAGLALWEAYTHRLLDQLKNVPVAVVKFEDVLARPAEVVHQLESALHDAGFAGWPQAVGYERWIQPSLRHQTEDDTTLAAYATPDQVKLYHALQRGWPVDRSALGDWSARNLETLKELEQFTHYPRLERDQWAAEARQARADRDEARRRLFALGEVAQSREQPEALFQNRLVAYRQTRSWKYFFRPLDSLCRAVGGPGFSKLLAPDPARPAAWVQVSALTKPSPLRQPLPRVCAMVPVHDEIRMVGPCLDHLIALGCHVHVFCDRSPPEVVAQAEQRLGRGVVAVEQRQSSTCFDLTALLREAEKFANQADYDWFLRCDVDEFRLPERPDESLPAFVARVEAAGFNAVNFRELVFIPTCEQPDHDHPRFRETMRRYYVFQPRPLFRCQLWKKPDGPIDLITYAGHRVDFPGMQVYPHFPPMCHYLYLSRDHFLKKYAARTYPKEELEKGWHGWRQRIADVEVQLPHDTELALYDLARPCEVDSSNPRTTPFLRLP